jgi:hypothetical protein
LRRDVEKREQLMLAAFAASLSDETGAALTTGPGIRMILRRRVALALVRWATPMFLADTASTTSAAATGARPTTNERA